MNKIMNIFIILFNLIFIININNTENVIKQINNEALWINNVDIDDPTVNDFTNKFNIEHKYNVSTHTELQGGLVMGEKILRKMESPYLLRTDLEIENGAKLIIEPGVTVNFAPMVGITVRGVLKAIGNTNNKIILGAQPNSGYEDQSLPEPQELGARLVDGPSPVQGRLQIFFKGKWRSTCTNSKNWTLADYQTVCRQMGYQGGNFWNWVERVWNNKPRLLFEEPNCRGIESSLFECGWSTRQLGSGVCDYHGDLGVQCLPRHEHVLAHWRGLTFLNAPSKKFLAPDNTVHSLISESELQYVSIIRAGSGRNQLTTSAIEVIGTPPVLRDITIDHSAFTGINVTKPDTSFTMKKITVRRSKGIGIFVNSSIGAAHFEDCTVNENGADGIRYVGHDLRTSERADRTEIYDFCTLPTTSGQTFPISVSLQQSEYAGSPKECAKYFVTKSGYVLTVNFVYFSMKENETAQIDIFDGSSANDRILTSWLIRNSTRMQSTVSTRERIYIRFRAKERSEILGYLKISTGPFKTYDLNVTNSVISDNAGRGIAVDYLRSQVYIGGSSILNNGHVSGLHVTSGAGDVNITNSKISFNNGDGINITYYGGNRNISKTSVSSNLGNGFSIWLNETKDPDRLEFLPQNQTTVIEYSKIFENLETGIRHGNFCGSSWVNITGNFFNGSFLDDINIQNCWFLQDRDDKKLFLQIGHNRFENNKRIGININPAINLKGKIEYNSFRFGKYGSIYIKNPLWEEFRSLPARFVIQNNEFTKNQGIYVVSLGVSPYSDKENQSILFTRNFVRENKIIEPFGAIDEKLEGFHGSGRLNPRSRIAAPIVVSSSNVDIFRNIISNRESNYEIGSQFSDQSQLINATYNWLGHTDEERIYKRLFHRKDRYDLAKIEYLPYLLHNSNPGATTIIAHPTYVPRFLVDGSEYIGGEVDGHETIPAGAYTVNRDISVRPGGKLIIQPGVILNFEPSVGMMVAGKLEARGRRPDDILFTLKRETIMTNENDTTDATITDENMEIVDIETETVINNKGPPNVPLRLLGGNSNHEGRLQVYLEGKWGTVCDYGWNIINAALVCHQLGYTLNPLDWQLMRSEIPDSGTSEDILLSNVRCTEHDIDFTNCYSEKSFHGEFENSCTHENDVGIKCFEGAWAGLRFGVLAERADIQYVTIEKAGLFDYTTNSFKPAVQLDFAKHNFENIRIVENLHDGMSVTYSDTFGGKSINNVKHSEFSNNWGNGISLKQLGLRIYGSVIQNNIGSGISHNPVVSEMEQRELSGWFKVNPDLNTFELEYEPYILPKNTENIDIDQWQSKHILTDRHYGENIDRKIFVRCPPGYVIGIQLLNPIDNRSTEEIHILDSQTENSRSDMWNIKRDLSTFPITSSSYGIVLYYKSGLRALGGTVFYFSTITAPIQDIKNRIVRGPVPTLLVKSSKIERNHRGISATYYNRYLGEKYEHYLRKANESIKLFNTEISHNKNEAIFIESPYWDVHVSNISEISIQVNNSLIIKNGQGIRQFSKDLRSSNNLFHYILQDNTIENNQGGGLDISLPYVWQYNENFTHSVYLNNNSWLGNSDFTVAIRGHFALVNISSNIFINNNCRKGLIALHGMEKQIKIDNNKMERNNGQFILEFKADSLSEILGEVPAIVTLNLIKNNTFSVYSSEMSQMGRMRARKEYVKDPTSVIRFGGIQKAVIVRNLISHNELHYDLIAGIRSARIKNFLIAKENWWGSIDVNAISSRIFDFDDWNNHAEVVYQPYLLENVFDASSSILINKDHEIDLNDFGGRIFGDITLTKTDIPYKIRSDITVMPDATLNINHGVIMEFHPNVGILVLGTLRAIGFRDSEIVLRSAKIKTKSEDYNRIERSVENMMSHDTIRLCTDRNCSSNENDVDIKHEGFLEYYNHTTLQWVPICDRRFTERNAQVVCREMGFDPINVYYSHDRRIEFHTNSLTRIWSWVEPLECQGTEARLELCPERLNGQLYGRRHECHWNDKFVFVSCNSETSEQQYWGGIRFANQDFERLTLDNHHLHDFRSSDAKQRPSQLEFMRIEDAGMLHNEKSPAIEAIYKTPIISSITINNSVHHGINIISPIETVNLKFVKINNVLGNGINIISLTGEGRESEESSFTPLKALDLPYHLFSMIDICDNMKEIIIEERVILYYKYDNNPVNCIKIFKTAFNAKPVGFRLLQANLFNHSKEYGRADAIHLYDGDIYNLTSIFIDKIEADTPNENKFFKTKSPTLTVRLIASGASAGHGFFAEVVTVPISTIGFNRDAQHNISYSEITNATNGAIVYSAAGEVTPILTLEGNRFENNGKQLYGNFSTCDYALNIDVQNMQSFYFTNNLVRKNQGGLRVRADSRGSATSLRGYIHHNLFTENKNRAVLQIEGRQSSPYQQITIYKNYISQNNAVYDDVIRLKQVVSNFTHNYVHSNYGFRIMEVSGFEKVRLNIYQTTAHNGFYDNEATDWLGRATIVAGTAGQRYVNNIFYNPNNDYEMITVNRSMIDFQYWNSTIEVWKTKIDAKYNYWSYNETLSVQSRIRDKSDNPMLLEVEAQPFYMNNKTILDEKCPPGWNLVGDTCYTYIGAPMTFYEAREFCRADNASLPFIKVEGSQLWKYLENEMRYLKYIEKVWVQDYNYIEQCTSFIYRGVEIEDCNTRLGFICEIDPKVQIDPLSWRADIFAISIISAFILVFILLALIGFCWYAKTKQRHVQRLERRNSIRQSLRSLNSIDPHGSIRRRNFNISTNTLTKSGAGDYKKMQSDGSIDSMDKSVLSSEASFEAFDRNPGMEYGGYNNNLFVEDKKSKSNTSNPTIAKTATIGSTRNAGKPSRTYAVPEFYKPPKNEFELSFRNEGFRDNSTFSGTRNNSLSTNLTEDTPIIHQTDTEDFGSDYYGNASTLPMPQKPIDNNVLKQKENELLQIKKQPTHSSFFPQKKRTSPQKNHSLSSTLPFNEKLDQFKFPSSNSTLNDTEIRNHDPIDLRRPDSYYTAVRASKAPAVPIKPYAAVSPSTQAASVTKRPKAVYKAAGGSKGEEPKKPPSYIRSKSEALLETNFDTIQEYALNNSLQKENRSYSQPLETDM